MILDGDVTLFRFNAFKQENVWALSPTLGQEQRFRRLPICIAAR